MAEGLSNTAGALRTFCLLNHLPTVTRFATVTDPFTPHTPFVMNAWAADASPLSVFVPVTTTNLLENFKRAISTQKGYIGVDATFKVTHNNFCIIVVATVDAASKGHLVCLAISDNEKAAAFSRLFRSILSTITSSEAEAAQLRLEVREGLSDGAHAIANAALGTFQNVNWKTCWPHLIVMGFRNGAGGVRNSISNKAQNVDPIKADLHRLHSLTSVSVFEVAYKLFKEKWIFLEEAGFVDHMEKVCHLILQGVEFTLNCRSTRKDSEGDGVWLSPLLGCHPITTT